MGQTKKMMFVRAMPIIILMLIIGLVAIANANDSNESNLTQIIKNTTVEDPYSNKEYTIENPLIIFVAALLVFAIVFTILRMIIGTIINIGKTISIVFSIFFLSILITLFIWLSLGTKSGLESWIEPGLYFSGVGFIISFGSYLFMKVMPK